MILFVSCSIDKKVDKIYSDMFNDIPLYDFYEFNPATANGNYFYDYLEYNDMIYTPDNLNAFFKSIGVYINGYYFTLQNKITVHVEYKADISSQDVAQSPEITMRKRTGDCEDYALLFMNLAYIISNGEVLMDLVLVKDFGTPRTIVNGGIPNHAQISYQGIIYEAQTGYPIYNSVMYRYIFWEVFKKRKGVIKLPFF